MAEVDVQNPVNGETTCGSLLRHLQKVWDEVGETDEERDKMLLQIEQECLDVYKRKVDQAAKARARLLQALADSKLELSTLLASLGEKSFVGIPEKTSGTINQQLAAIAPALEQLLKQKEERRKEFLDVQTQIQKICTEIAGGNQHAGSPTVDESDLSLKKLDAFRDQLQELQKEKSDRLHKVLEFVSTVHDLCAVLGLDFYTTVTEVHPSLNDATGVQSKSISNDTLARLANAVLALKEDKKQRLKKLQELVTQLIELWNLMDTSEEERSLFGHVTCNVSASVDEVTAVNLTPGAISMLVTCKHTVLEPVVQVIKIKCSHTETEVKGNRVENKKWYGITLSDGLVRKGVIISEKINEMVRSKQLQKGSVVQLTHYSYNGPRDYSFIFVDDLNVICCKCILIGDPKPYSSNKTPPVKKSIPPKSNEDHVDPDVNDDRHHADEHTASKQKCSCSQTQSKKRRSQSSDYKEDDEIGACFEKLEKLGWGEGPMYDTAVLLFGESSDYRKIWLHLKPKSCVNWVKNAGSKYGLLG